MATIHFGTATTLATIPKANISNGDIGYIWHASFSRKMVYDSTAINATDTTNHPYHVRPNDYASAGVWGEDVGAEQPEVWSADQIVTGQLRSTNCTTATGSEYNLDNATIKLGGTQVDAAGSYRGIFAGLDSELYKLYAGDGTNKYFKFDGTNISWRGANASLSTTGVFTATNAVLTGTITAPTGAIGGWVINSENLYGLASGTPATSPSDGIVLKSGSSAAISVYENTEKRIEFGYLSAGVYGIKAYATNGTTDIFEISDTQQKIAGWTIDSTRFYNGTNIILDSSNKKISINDATFGNDGIQLDYNSGNPRAYIGDGSNKYFNFDGTNLSWKGVNTELTTAGLFSASRLVATGGTIANWSVETNYLTSTNIGLHSASAASGAQILIGHGTSYASAKIGLKADGSGKLASGNISWNTIGDLALSGPFSSSATITGGIFTINTSGYIHSASKATYGDPTAGFFLGYDIDAYKLSIGDATRYLKYDGSSLTLNLDANVGTSVGIIYKGGKRWLYDFNPPPSAFATLDGFNLFLGTEAGNLDIGSGGFTTDDGSYNTGIGYQALMNLAKGSRNVGVGYQALHGLTGGNDNVGIGISNLYSVTLGFKNVAIGTETLYDLTTGHSNVALGWRVLQNTTTGSFNIGMGEAAFSNLSTGEYNIAIGRQAGSNQSDNDTGLEHPRYSIYIGDYATSGSDPAGGEDEIDNEIVIGASAVGNGSDTITLGYTDITEFHCQVALTVDSDERIKRNISPSLVGLSFVNALNPITFQPKNPFDYPDKIKPPEYKDRTVIEKDKDGKEKEKVIKADKRPPDNDRIYLGLSAQEVEQVMAVQGVNSQIVVTSNRGKKAITYGNLIMPLITAVQELSQKVGQLEVQPK